MSNQDDKRASSTTNSEALCPGCHRFVGPYTTCPYCGTAILGRTHVAVVKIFAIGMATIGLLALLWIAQHKEIPSVAIAEIQSLMNLALVKIEGQITRNVSYDPDTQYFGFWVNDGTGEIYISIYQQATQDLLNAGMIPALGDEVSLAGTVRIRADYASLTLHSTELLTIHRPEPAAFKIADITPLDEGRRVTLQGDIISCTSPYSGLTLLSIRDGTGEMTVTIDESILTLTGEVPDPGVGQRIVVTGTVTLYQGSPQLALGDSTELTQSPASIPAVTVHPINRITVADLGSQVLVQGRVVAMEGINGGMKAILDDGTAQIVIVLWSQIYSALAQPRALDVGASVSILGKVSAYEGELEIIPQLASDITLVNPAADIPWVSLDSLATSHAGQLVRVRGMLGEPEGFSAGIKIPLLDGTGRVIVLFWSNIYQELKPRPVKDMLVEITGVVNVYNERLEIIPRSALDVVNIDQGE